MLPIPVFDVAATAQLIERQVGRIDVHVSGDDQHDAAECQSSSGYGRIDIGAHCYVTLQSKGSTLLPLDQFRRLISGNLAPGSNHHIRTFFGKS